MCEWDGDVTESHDYTHNYYTHTIVRDSEMFLGKTCSERTNPNSGLLSRLLGR